MPELNQRQRIENELREPLADLLRAQQRRIVDDYLTSLERGEPFAPPISPAEQQRMRAELAVLLVLLLYGVHRLASRQMQQQLRATVAALALVTNHQMAARAEQWVERHAPQLAQEITDNTIRMLSERYARGVREAAADVARARAEFLDSLDAIFGQQRADRIAATETTRAAVAGERDLVEQAQRDSDQQIEPLVTPYWQTEQDDRVCPVCGPLHEQPEQRWPEALRDGPPAHVNCRCFLDWREAMQPKGEA